MTAVRLAIDAYRRLRAGEPEIVLQNRFFEANPTNLNEKVALIIRPALKFRTAVGDGPIRQLHSQSGTFNDDMFVVSGIDFFRVKKVPSGSDIVTQIAGAVGGLELDDTPEICIRNEPDHLFVVDGANVWETDTTYALTAITTPDDTGVVSIDIINSYIIIVMANSQRCYWINPGEIIIDPLNFFEAERSPDWLYQVRTVGDQFWLLGAKTTEVWRMTGQSAAPFQRIEGRIFDNGIWSGTAVQIKDDVVVTGEDGRVYRVTDAPNPVSNPGIAEIIRDAIKVQMNTD